MNLLKKIDSEIKNEIKDDNENQSLLQNHSLNGSEIQEEQNNKRKDAIYKNSADTPTGNANMISVVANVYIF